MFILKRPLVMIDFETTGLNTQEDRIIEYSFCIVFPDGIKEIKTGYLNPGIPISESSTLIHGIKDEDVSQSPTFCNLAKGMLAFIDGCDLGGFNSNHFDFPLLYAEFLRAGITWDYSKHYFIDVGTIFKRKEERTLAAAVRFYCNREIEGAHSAEADILATFDVLTAQIDKYPDLPSSMEELALYSNFDKKRLDMAGKFVTDKDGIILFNFGKQKGKPATDFGFLRWMVFCDPPFPPDTLAIAQKLMNEL